jgi:O-antigen/teichoic acid export membrane protein
MSLRRHATIAFTAEAAVLGLSVLSGVATARLLGPDAYGQVAVVASAAALLFTFFRLALADAIARVWAERRDDAPALAGTLMGLAAGLGAASMVAGEALLAFAGGSLFEGIDPWTVRAGLLFVPAMLASALLASLLQMRGDVPALSAARVAGKAVVVAIIAAAAAILFAKFGGSIWSKAPDAPKPPFLSVATILWIANVGVAVTLLFQWRALRRAIPAPWRCERALAAELLRHSFAGYPGYIALFALARLDFFMLKALTPSNVADAALGHYAVAYALAEMATYVGYSISLAVSPRIAGDDLPKAAREAARALRWIALLGGAAALAMALFAPWLVWLYGGDRFLASGGAAGALAILAPGLACHYLYVQCHALMVRRGWFATTNALLIAAATANGLLNLWLIPSMGIEGAALATTIAMAALALAGLLAAHVGGAMPLRLLLNRENGDLRSSLHTTNFIRAYSS